MTNKDKVLLEDCVNIGASGPAQHLLTLWTGDHMIWKPQHMKPSDPISSSPWNVFWRVNRKLKSGI